MTLTLAREREKKIGLFYFYFFLVYQSLFSCGIGSSLSSG